MTRNEKDWLCMIAMVGLMLWALSSMAFGAATDRIEPTKGSDGAPTRCTTTVLPNGTVHTRCTK